MWTADMKSNEKWSSQLWSQFLQLNLAIPVRRSTNWAMKPLTLGAGQIWVHMFPWKICEWTMHIRQSSPVEVLNFFQASLRNCKNCDHNCEDHSSFVNITACYIFIATYTSNRKKKSSQSNHVSRGACWSSWEDARRLRGTGGSGDENAADLWGQSAPISYM